MFFNLIRAEWIKLSRRPMVTTTLVVFLVLMLVQYIFMFLAILFHDGVQVDASSVVQVQFLAEEQAEILRRFMSFPGIFGAVLSQINSIGAICAIILTAGAMGGEYGWGTLRVQLARQPRRGRYLAAKAIVLLFILLLGIIIAMATGTIMGLLFGLIRDNAGSVSTRHLWLVPLGMLRALYIWLPYVMFTIAISTIGRSALAGVAGGVVFLILDLGVGGLSFVSSMGGILTFLYNLTIQPNITTLAALNGSSFGVDTSQAIGALSLSNPPHPIQATILVGLYSILFFGYASYWLTSRDITGAQ